MPNVRWFYTNEALLLHSEVTSGRQGQISFPKPRPNVSHPQHYSQEKLFGGPEGPSFHPISLQRLEIPHGEKADDIVNTPGQEGAFVTSSGPLTKKVRFYVNLVAFIYTGSKLGMAYDVGVHGEEGLSPLS